MLSKCLSMKKGKKSTKKSFELTATYFALARKRLNKPIKIEIMQKGNKITNMHAYFKPVIAECSLITA